MNEKCGKYLLTLKKLDSVELTVNNTVHCEASSSQKDMFCSHGGIFSLVN